MYSIIIDTTMNNMNQYHIIFKTKWNNIQHSKIGKLIRQFVKNRVHLAILVLFITIISWLILSVVFSPYQNASLQRLSSSQRDHSTLTRRPGLDCISQMQLPGSLEHWLGIEAIEDGLYRIPGANSQSSFSFTSSMTQIQRETKLFRDRLDSFDLIELLELANIQLVDVYDLIDSSIRSSSMTDEVPVSIDLGLIHNEIRDVSIDVPVYPHPVQFVQAQSASRDPVGFVTTSFVPELNANGFGASIQHLQWNNNNITSLSKSIEISETNDVCVAVMIPHSHDRVKDVDWPRWNDIGPVSLRGRMFADKAVGGFERNIEFKLILAANLEYTSVNTPEFIPLLFDAGDASAFVTNDRRDQIQKLMNPMFHVERVVEMQTPSSAEDRFHVNITMSFSLQFQSHVDLGFDMYVASVPLPIIYDHHAPSLTSDIVANPEVGLLRNLTSPVIPPETFKFEASLEYRNYEWNPEPPIEQIPPELVPVRLLSDYITVLKKPIAYKVHSGRICPSGNHSGYWAHPSSRYAQLQPSLSSNMLETSFYADECSYRRYSREAAFQCLAKFNVIHWFGDSNSRRALRMLYTGDRWGEEVMKSRGEEMCEDHEDTSIAGSWYQHVHKWPYPLPTAIGDVCTLHKYSNYSVFRMPSHDGEPLSCNNATGSTVFYRFISGLGGKGSSEMLFDTYMEHDLAEWPKADLVVVNSGTWESQESVWELKGPASPEKRMMYNMTNRLEILIDILEKHYVLPNPDIRIVFRPSNAWLTPKEASIRRHTTARMAAIGQRLKNHLLRSRIARNIVIWDVQQTLSPTLHQLEEFATYGSSCYDGHSGIPQIALDNQILLNLLCNDNSR